MAPHYSSAAREHLPELSKYLQNFWVVQNQTLSQIHGVLRLPEQEYAVIAKDSSKMSSQFKLSVIG